jgi:tetratricopeptide (TPR) repeat protein
VESFETQRNHAQFEAAVARWRTGDVDGCRAALEDLLQRDPDHREGHLLTAELLLLSDEPEKALQHARGVIERRADDAPAQHTAGLALEALNRREEALACYEQATKVDTSNELFRLTYEHALEAAGGPAPNIEPPPITGPAPTGVAEADVAKATDVPTSTTVSLIADDAQTALRAAAQALEQNQPERAIQFLNAAIGRTPDSAALYRALGAAYYRQREYVKAQVALEKAVSLDKSSALSYFLLSDTLDKLGRSEEAQRHWQRAAALDPKFAALR